MLMAAAAKDLDRPPFRLVEPDGRDRAGGDPRVDDWRLQRSSFATSLGFKNDAVLTLLGMPELCRS